MSGFYVLIILAVVAVIVYLIYNRYKLLPMLKLGIVLLLIGMASAQNVTILDNKPVILPEIGRGLEEVGSGWGPMLGLPDPGCPNCYREELLCQMGFAAFLQDEGLNVTANNTTLFYA